MDFNNEKEFEKLVIVDLMTDNSRTVIINGEVQDSYVLQLSCPECNTILLFLDGVEPHIENINNMLEAYDEKIRARAGNYCAKCGQKLRYKRLELLEYDLESGEYY